LYFLTSARESKWTQAQAWTLVKILSSTPEIPYDSVLLDPLFGQDETPLHELAQAELISIGTSPEGRPSLIRPGRPVFSAAFNLLIRDAVFHAKMELLRLTFMANEGAKAIDKCEEELAKLRMLPRGQLSEMEPRIRYLLRKIQVSQKSIEGFEKDMTGVKKILSTKA
jgi:RNA12 protein